MGALFLFMSLPPLIVSSLRGRALALFSPLMKTAHSSSRKNEQVLLESENHLLRSELNKWHRRFELNPTNRSKIVAAHVIYRDPGSWSSSLWIDVGSGSDPIVQKKSPVIVGNALIGMIDYVGKKQARVRLISDMGLQPAVRAIRGLPQNMNLIEHLLPLIRHLNHRSDLPLSKEEQSTLLKTLTQFKERLFADYEGWYGAKGILQGGGTPLWRSVNQTLRGIGFNYDFPDEKGPARELMNRVPIIAVADLLVTTGLDGIFPEGLAVAEVTQVYPLREGAYTYEIEAVPVAGNLDLLQTLFVIPPVGYDEADQPGFL